jgi:hypothetical protein
MATAFLASFAMLSFGIEKIAGLMALPGFIVSFYVIFLSH